jgi:hypothetical protein
VLGVGIAGNQAVTSSLVEITDSIVSCNDRSTDGPATYRGATTFLSSTVGVIGVAATDTATNVAVVLSNATVSSLSGMNWTDANTNQYHCLVGLAGIAALTHVNSNVTTHRSLLRAVGFFGATIGHFVSVGVSGYRDATQVSVAASEGTIIDIANVSVFSVVSGVCGIGFAIFGFAGVRFVAVDVRDSVVSVVGVDVASGQAAVGGIGLGAGQATLSDASVTVATTSLVVTHMSAAPSSTTFGVGMAAFYATFQLNVSVAVRHSTVAVWNCLCYHGVGGVGITQVLGAASGVDPLNVLVTDSNVTIRDVAIHGVVAVGVFRDFVLIPFLSSTPRRRQ